jgi:hypothetical protein
MVTFMLCSVARFVNLTPFRFLGWFLVSQGLWRGGAPTAAGLGRPPHMASLSQFRIHNSALLAPRTQFPHPPKLASFGFVRFADPLFSIT